jgi:type III restriction enzyme
MELILKEGLLHQETGIQAVCNVFDDNCISRQQLYYTNPIVDIRNAIIADNIKKIQAPIHPENRGNEGVTDYLNLDIKMETGTGKTYVYVATIFELHKRYKLNKFIIVVPSLAIKAGTKQFIEDAYVKQHFRDVCKYGTEIELQVLEAKKTKKGKSYFPSTVREFVTGSYQNANKIYVLLSNMALLTDRDKSILTRDDYDYGVEGFYRPAEAIKATKPVIIIDEPHRFSKDQKTFDFISKSLCPQSIIRYGATFPSIQTGKGKTKKTVKDYHHLLYDLNACDAFNQNLIKGIAKEHFEPLSKREDKVKITSIVSKASVKFSYIQKDKPTKSKELKKGDSLSLITDELTGIDVSAIGPNYIELSNGQIKYQGEEFSTDIYSSSYQEQMLKLAIERHFETEKANFDRKFKIKTLALFFIDDIHSYRKDDKSEKEPYLKNIFERLLRERIETELANHIDTDNIEYKEYLLASKGDIASCHAGYFSQDNSDSDEEIAKEVNEILFGKKQLLSIKAEDGKYNTRRFLFSKWTLKEGWDNPNVFTIAKLRSSGSDNSKLQEVGRGLRLPVDENGNRISNEEFKLNYIVDFTEADFADKLVKEINDELPIGFKITDIKLQEVAKKMNISANDLFKQLLQKDFIDMNRNIVPEKAEIFFEEYTDFTTGINSGKITDRNTKADRKVKIRPARYNELKQLWEAINHKYVLYYDKIEDDNYLQKEISKIFAQGVFTDVVMTSKRQVVSTDAESGRMIAGDRTGVQYIVEKPIAYNEFLKRINRQTNIPIRFLHNALCCYSETEKITKNQINEYSAANFVYKFNDWKNNALQGRFKYQKTNIKLTSTALTDSNGNPNKEITQGRIGTKFIEGTPIDKYLYDSFAYDSPLEKDNIMTNIDEIVVYGKIPKSSIAIPTITGSTYSPDFMYIVKRTNGEKSLNIVVETKDVENQTELRGTEKAKINCAKVFFGQLTIDGYKVEFHEQLNNKKIKQIIEEVLAGVG